MAQIKNQLRVRGQAKQHPPGKFNDAVEPQQAQMASGNKGLADDAARQTPAKKPMTKKKDS